MIGLAFIAAFIIYLAISIGVVVFVVRWAKRGDRRPVLWGIIAAFIMYNLVFWDFIPTYTLYKYYCTTKAGFWVYKTPEKWKVENPGVAETLRWKENPDKYENVKSTRGYRLNERFIWLILEERSRILPVQVTSSLIIDSKSGEKVVQLVGISSGYRDGRELIRFWVNFPLCRPNVEEFRYFFKEFHEMGGEIK